MMSLRSFLYGLTLTAGATALSAVLSFWGFQNTYYMGPLLPLFMAIYLLLAWLLHLKATGLSGSSLELKDTIKHPETRLGTDLPDDKTTGAEVSTLRDENGLVRRRPLPGDTQGGEARSRESTIAALVWSALQLAILATALYHFLGVGARFSRP